MLVSLEGLPGAGKSTQGRRLVEWAHGPDPLHLAAVFGLDDKTAIRYATAARQLLHTPIEEQLSVDPRFVREP